MRFASLFFDFRLVIQRVIRIKSYRHAEIVYAECLVQKAFLSIMYSGDWFAVVKVRPYFPPSHRSHSADSGILAN